MKNPFVDAGNEVLIGWFDEATNAAPGIYVITGPIGSAISSTADRLVTGIQSMDKKCCTGLASDKSYFENAVTLAQSGYLVIIPMIACSIDKATEILESYQVDGAIELIYGFISQYIDKSTSEPKLVSNYTKTEKINGYS